jgi:glucokinase-like ROK family protein
LQVVRERCIIPSFHFLQRQEGFVNGQVYLYSLANVKSFNRHAILDLIRFTSGGISRAELARKMGLSRAAVSSIVNDLLGINIVRETQATTTTSGRRPIMLEIEPEHGHVLGVDIGVTHLAIILADLSARVVSEIEVPFDISGGPESCLDEVDRQVQSLLAQAGLSPKDVLSAGIGVPGPIAGDGGIVIAPPIMPGWDNFPIRSDLKKRWGCPVALNNDAELGALGEWAYGAGREESNLIYVKVGSGVGAGLLLDNHIYRGATGTAGEIGHMTVDNDGPVCTCGNRGCLEAIAGGRAIAQQAKRAVLSRRRTQLTLVEPLDKLTAKDVALAAGRGDLIAQQILSEAGEYLGTAIAGLINLLNPGIVVIGGGVAQAGDLLLEPIRQAVQFRSLKAAVQAVRITSAVLGRRSTSMGAVVQALSIYLHQLAEK